jgi:hypothetical protein
VCFVQSFLVFNQVYFSTVTKLSVSLFFVRRFTLHVNYIEVKVSTLQD